MTGFDSDFAENPLVPFSEKATRSPALGDSEPNNLGAIGVGSASTDPVSVRPLSQMAWDQMNPQQQAEATAETLTGGAVSQAAGIGAGGSFASDFVDGVFFDASQGGAVDPDGSTPGDTSVDLGDESYGYGPRRAPRTNFATDDPAKATKIVEFAKSMLGRPYIWGGTSRAGVDCSGLVQLAYAAAGIPLPRLSYTQLQAGKQVRVDQLKPGDLVGWDQDQPGFGGVDHIAIYIGNGQYIEAPRPGLFVRIGNLADTSITWAVRIPGAPAPFAGKSATARRVESGRITIRQAEYEGAQRAKRKPKYTHRASGHPTRRTSVKSGTNTNARRTRTRKNRQLDAINRGR